MGQEVRGFAIGDRVSGEGHITCGFCRNCRAGRRHLCRNTVGVGVDREGAFAEYLVIPAFNAFKIPDDIPDEIAAIFDPFGNATHTALSFNLVGEDVLITGAGPIGCMAAAIARHVGARHVVVTDVNAYRLELARRMGATHAVNVTRTKLPDVMYHDPCHTPMKTYSSIAVVNTLMGAPVAPNNRCCGESGSLATTRPDISTQVRFRKEQEMRNGAAALRDDGFAGDVKVLTSCPSCLQGLSRFDGDAGTSADYIVVEIARRTLGANWMADYVAKAGAGGIERVLV